MNQPAGELSPQRSTSVMIWTALGAVYLIWGSTYLAIRFTVETTPPFLSAAARFIISGGYSLSMAAPGRRPGTDADRAPQRRTGRYLSTGRRQWRRGLGGAIYSVELIGVAGRNRAALDVVVRRRPTARRTADRQSVERHPHRLLRRGFVDRLDRCRHDTGKFLRCPRRRRRLAAVGHRLDLRQNTSLATHRR